MKLTDLTEGSICKKISAKYAGNCKYKLANAYIFKRDWESDFFVQKDNGYAYEFEIKISRSDFFNDKKKVEKHLILETGIYHSKGWQSTWNNETKCFDHEEKATDQEHTFRPNKFFYVVPEGLISAFEIPKYAGLMYVPADQYKEIITVKEAPFIHKDKLKFEKILCSKFYHYWLEQKRKVMDLELQIKSHERLQNSRIELQNVQVSDTTEADSSNADE